MSITKISIETWLTLPANHLLIDVRSPSEFKQAHIPGAYNLPLLSDEERKIIGTLYKQESREIAIKRGLEFFGPKMRKMVEEIERFLRKSADSSINTLIIHCWRGGMRSATVAWLFDIYGFKVYTIEGGYKKYRHWVLELFTQDYPIQIVGGYTGSAKTDMLQQLHSLGEKIIDLEHLANHKGSAFGAIGMPTQPSQEMFENKLALALSSISSNTTPIWVEDESQRIGLVNIPQPLWNQLRTKQVYFFDIPFEERLTYLVAMYGILPHNKLAEAILRIQKKLGGLETKTALQFLEEQNITEAFRILLHYYDKLYLKGLKNRPTSFQQEIILSSHTCNSTYNVALLLEKYNISELNGY
jgi:tRNA 2-selenouridine synthase